MSAEVLQSCCWVRGLEFLRTKQFRFETSTDVVNNINLVIATKKTDDNDISLAASATKRAEEPHPQIISFEKFSSYRNLLQVTAYVLRLLPSEEGYPNVGDDSIIDTPELDEAERHLHYLVQEEPFSSEKIDLLENKFVKWSTHIAAFSHFVR